MAYVAMRGSAAVNAVSRLHGDVSRQIFQSPSPGANRTWRRWIDTSLDSPTTSCRGRTRHRSRGPRIGRRRTAWRSSTRHLSA